MGWNPVLCKITKFILDLRMAREGWSPKTMTLSDEVIRELSRRAAVEGKAHGIVADEALCKVFFWQPEDETEIDHSEVLDKLQECIRVHWHGDRVGFINALRKIVGKRVPYYAVAQWTEKKRITEPELSGLEELFKITDLIPKAPSEG